MLQVLRKGLKDIVVEEVPEPSIRTGEVKIKVACSLISSGTELAGLHSQGLVREVIQDRNRIGTMIGRAIMSQGIVKTAKAISEKFSELTITGYSGAGIVIEKASNITDLDLGQRVAYGGVETGHAEIVCAPRNLIAPLPSNVGLKEGSLATVGSIALHAVRNTEITIGDTVAVIGLGLVGQLVVQLACLSGARVFGIDIKKERMDQAIDQGAEVALDASENPENTFIQLTNGQGVDAVIICASSKTSQPLELAVQIARSRARVIVVGMIKMEIPWEAVYLKELKLTISRAYGPGSYDLSYEKKGIDYPIDYVRWTENRNMAEFLRLISIGQIKSDSIITHEFPLNEAPTAFQQLSSAQGKIVGAVLSYPDSGSGDLKSREKRTMIPIPIAKGKILPRTESMRVGIIGIGNIARWVHLPNVKKHQKLILKGVCTPKGYRAKYFGERYKSEYCTTDYRKIIEDPNIDIVMICTRDKLHAKIALEALKAGKHVFVEKPMALTREDCIRLVQVVKETGLGFMVNFNRRYSPIYQKAKESILDKGPKIISIRMNNPDMTRSYWMMDTAEGAGAIIGEGCHFFDQMAWFTQSDPVSIFAHKLVLPGDAITSMNNIVCTLSFRDGSVGTLIYETIGHRKGGSERVEISAGGVTALVDELKTLSIWKGSAPPFLRPKRKKKMIAEKGYYPILGAFVKGIQNGRSFEDEARAGAMSSLCALAAIKSIETGLCQQVEIN